MSQSQSQANQQRQRGRPRLTETAAASVAELLGLVRKHQALTRLELEKISSFGRAVVSDRLTVLSELGLSHENETGISGGGRVPRIVSFSKSRAVLVAASIDQSSVSVALSDLSGNLTAQHHEQGDLGLDASDAADRMITLIRLMLSRQTKLPDLWGVSISVPGPIGPSGNGRPLTSTPEFLKGWNESKLVERLMAEFLVPVWLIPSVETMTVGELHGGTGKNNDCMLFIKTGKRFTAGLIYEGRPYRGATGAVGLIGQLPATHEGNLGTLDSLAGAEFIEQAALREARNGTSEHLTDLLNKGGELTLNDICQAAQLGDPVCVSIITASGKLVGTVLATLLNMLNPQCVILAGALAQTNDIFLAAVREAVYGASHPLATRDLQILQSQLGNTAGLLGAAHICLDYLFEPKMLRGWVMAGTPLKHPDIACLRQLKIDSDGAI